MSRSNSYPPPPPPPLPPEGSQKGVALDLFINASAYAKSYGKAKLVTSALASDCYTTSTHFIFCDSKGTEIYRLPLSLVAIDSGARARACAWARSLGYPVPVRPSPVLTFFLILIGLLCFILPGLVVLIWVAYSEKVYERDMNALVARWVDAGKPEPGVIRNEAGISTKETNITMGDKLRELKELHDAGLVSEDEFVKLRQKYLDL